MKKIIAVFLLVSAVFLSVSCGSTVAEPTEIDFDWGDTVTDELVGGDYVVWQQLRETDPSYILGFQQDAPLGDEILTRIDTIEKNHDCTLTVVDEVSFVQMVASGLHPCDILYVDLYDFRGFVKSDLLVPVDEYMDVIDINDTFRWGFPNCLETMMHNGTLYGVYPACWPGNVGGYCFVLICNSGILYRNGYSHPQEYVENGEWTRDKLVDIIINCYDKSSEVYGLETLASWWGRMCVFANGVNYVVKNLDGTYAYGLDTEAAIEGLTYAKESVQKMGDARSETKNDLFAAGKAAFTLDWGQNALIKYPYNTLIEDVSMLPFPGNPAYIEYGKWTGYTGVYTSTISMPITVDNVTAVAKLIDELYAPIAGIECEQDLFDYYSKNVFFHENDFKSLYQALQNSEYSYSPDGEVFNVYNNIIDQSMHISPIEAIETLKDKGWNAVQSFALKNKLAYEKYFGIDYFEYAAQH